MNRIGHTEPGARLPREFFAREPEVVAQDLLGCILQAPPITASSDPVRLRITEVEAYHGEQDPASHAFRGLTERTAPMFGPAGLLYVYFVYGVHWCANIVTGHAGAAAAVLLRAAAVVGGIDQVRQRRRSAAGRIPADRDLARGPARLASCLALTGAHSGADLLADDAPFAVLGRAGDPPRMSSGPRVGVSAAAAVPWRFWISDDPTVSVYRASKPRRRQPE